MSGPRPHPRRSLRTQFLLPGGLLGIAALGTLALFFPGASANGTTPASTTTTTVSTTSTTTPLIEPLAVAPTTAKTKTKSDIGKACGSVNLKGVSPAPSTGDPFTSNKLSCYDGQLISYGDNAITYTNPPSSYDRVGRQLFDQTCSSCHGFEANGVGPGGKATIGPNLQGVGAATVDFWVSTGRMPATDIKAVEAERKTPRLSPKQALEVAAYVNSLDPSVPAVPTPNLKKADLADGATLFSLNCAACHTITGAGDALAFGTNAPSLQNRSITPQQVTEAMRIGPANMPRFSGNLTDSQVRDVVAYVTQQIQHPASPGGAGLGGVGPVAEGFVALLIGVGGLVLICFWIGERS